MELSILSIVASSSLTYALVLGHRLCFVSFPFDSTSP